MQIKNEKRFFGGLNTDSDPSELPDGDYVDGKNIRTLSSASQHGAGPAETLQGEISILINPDSLITYYGSAIGGSFVYPGFEEVTIGDQTWMKKNYSAEYPGSKSIDNNADNDSIYGKLYTHNQSMAADFVPSGWRVPTEADIDILIAELLGAAVAGGKMKEQGDSHWTTPNTGASDSSGFRAVPGGKFDLLFDLLGENCLLWLQDDGVPTPPFALNGSGITAVTFIANWDAVIGVDGYYLDVATDVDFTAMVVGFDDLDVGNVLFYEVVGLAGETEYFFRVRAYNEIGASENSNTKSLTTLWRADDWFSPSLFEGKEMYDELKLFGVGGFTDERYWTSTEFDATQAKCIPFDSGGFVNTLKSNTNNVRACRSFVAGIGAYSLRDPGPAGGLIFYIDGAGTGYLEAAPSDQSADYVWSNENANFLNTTLPDIGEGQNNTDEIIAQPDLGMSAARLCDDFYIDVL